MGVGLEAQIEVAWGEYAICVVQFAYLRNTMLNVSNKAKHPTNIEMGGGIISSNGAVQKLCS